MSAWLTPGTMEYGWNLGIGGAIVALVLPIIVALAVDKFRRAR